jgi:hypothetical protein
MDQRSKALDQTQRPLFVAKYRGGVILVKDGVTRIVKSVVFSAEQKIWQLLTAQANHDEYDDLSYVEDPENHDIKTIDVTTKKGGPSSLTKEFNKRTTTDLM